MRVCRKSFSHTNSAYRKWQVMQTYSTLFSKRFSQWFSKMRVCRKSFSNTDSAYSKWQVMQTYSTLLSMLEFSQPFSKMRACKKSFSHTVRLMAGHANILHSVINARVLTSLSNLPPVCKNYRSSRTRQQCALTEAAGLENTSEEAWQGEVGMSL